MQKDFKPMEKKCHIFIITTDSRGLPHVETANRIESVSGQCLEIRCCSCSQTMANLWDNTHILLLLWDADHSLGLRLKGKLLQIKRMIFHNENTSNIDGMIDFHMEMELVVRIDEVTEIEPVCHEDKKASAVRFPICLHQRSF